ncbi:hypothetical protein [Parapedobacter tibetensis]|nr:hypothetical protein [Parapedobacter tibetensis]
MNMKNLRLTIAVIAIGLAASLLVTFLAGCEKNKDAPAGKYYVKFKQALR